MELSPEIVRALHVRSSARDAVELVALPFLNFEPSIVGEAVCTRILIALNDALQGLKRAGREISWTEDCPKEFNVTDLINATRNGACHMNSGDRKVDTNWVSWVIISGKMPKAMLVNGCTLGCDYEDDAAIYYGENRVYLRRHLHRVAAECDVEARRLAEELGVN